MGVQIAGVVVDSKFSPNTHTWIPREQEVASIAGPLARIAARHAPNLEGAESNDVIDGLEAGLATAGYVLRARMETIARATEEQQAAQNQYGGR